MEWRIFYSGVYLTKWWSGKKPFLIRNYVLILKLFSHISCRNDFPLFKHHTRSAVEYYQWTVDTTHGHRSRKAERNASAILEFKQEGSWRLCAVPNAVTWWDLTSQRQSVFVTVIVCLNLWFFNLIYFVHVSINRRVSGHSFTAVKTSKFQTDSCGWVWTPVIGSCEHNNEPSGYIKC